MELESVTTPRKVATKNNNNEEKPIERSLEKNWEMAAGKLLESFNEMQEVVETLTLREQELCEKERQLTVTAKEENICAKNIDRLQRKEEYLNNLETKILKEQQMLDIGRQRLINDKNRHQAMMRYNILAVKNQASEEIKKFAETVKAEVARFPAAPYKEFFKSSGVEVAEALMNEIKEMDEECKKLWG